MLKDFYSYVSLSERKRNFRQNIKIACIKLPKVKFECNELQKILALLYLLLQYTVWGVNMF